MKSTRTIIKGIILLALGCLGIYCSIRAFQAHRDLHGAIDVEDSVRDWSIGATACVVACGVITTAGRKKAD
jgi:hypothetical protein